MRFIIEVMPEGILRKLELDDKVYTEFERKSEFGTSTFAPCITTQMENDGLYEKYGELIDAIDADDPMEIWYAMRDLEY